MDEQPDLAYNASAADGNPLKGFLPSPEWTAWPYAQEVPSSLEYFYIRMRDVMPGNSTDYSGFDTSLEPKLAAAASRGRTVVLRFILDYPGTDYTLMVPQWLLDANLAFNNYSDIDICPASGRATGCMSPDSHWLVR